jgi:Arc/MetJ family transcription regulator
MKSVKHAKRTNLVLEPDQLEEARHILGTKTYSETVTKALAETIRKSWVMKLQDLAEKVQWDGDLSAMRDDRPRKRPTRKRTRR